MDALHDVAQQALQFLFLPGDACRVLAHLETGNGHAAGVRRLARREQDARCLKSVHAFEIGRHVGAFGNRIDAVGQHHPGIVAADLVLRRAREGDLAGHDPGPLTGVEAAAELLRVLLDAPTADVLQLLDERQFLVGEAGRIVDEAVRVGERDRLAAEVQHLLDRMLGNVAGTGHQDGRIFHGPAGALEHVFHEVHGAVAGGFGADRAATVLQALAGQDTDVAIGDALELAEHVADLATTDADVAGRNVDILTDMAVQLGHEGLAETHHFGFRLALRVEVGAALAAAHRQAGQRVLESLLEGQELEHALVDRRMEADAALVGSDRAVVLDAIAAVDADMSGIVLPADAKRDHPVRLGHALEDLVLVVFRVVADVVEYALGDFTECLDELGLPRVALLHTLDEFIQARY